MILTKTIYSKWIHVNDIILCSPFLCLYHLFSWTLSAALSFCCSRFYACFFTNAVNNTWWHHILLFQAWWLGRSYSDTPKSISTVWGNVCCCHSSQRRINGSGFYVRPSLEALALTKVITCVVTAVVPQLDAEVGGGGDVEMFNDSISSKSLSSASELPLINTKTTISTLVSSPLLNYNHLGWGS